jgi:hypothetical protein
MKYYLNTTGGLWFMLTGKRTMRRWRSGCVQGVFNPIYKVKYYYCIHIRSPFVVWLSCWVSAYSICRHAAQNMVYLCIFSTFNDLCNVNGQQRHTFGFLWTGSSLVARKDYLCQETGHPTLLFLTLILRRTEFKKKTCTNSCAELFEDWSVM